MFLVSIQSVEKRDKYITVQSGKCYNRWMEKCLEKNVNNNCTRS